MLAGTEKKVNRTVTFEMSDDMRFSPAGISVRKGETIHFDIDNNGKLRHEFVLGTEKALKEHAELMKKFPHMEHAQSNRVTVLPGEAGEVVWQFTKAGEILFACLQPGHDDAGMKGAASVGGAKEE